MEFPLPLYASATCHASALQHAHADGFSLVVIMVGKTKHAHILLNGPCDKLRVARLSCPGFTVPR